MGEVGEQFFLVPLQANSLGEVVIVFLGGNVGAALAHYLEILSEVESEDSFSVDLANNGIVIQVLNFLSQGNATSGDSEELDPADVVVF